MDLGAFILGVLFGWLVEWLYVSFFGSSSKGSEECTAFERELKTRNEEIKALKSQIGGNVKGSASLLSEQAAATISRSNKPQSKKTKSGSKPSNVGAATTTKGTVTKKSATKATTAKNKAHQKTAVKKNSPDIKKTTTKDNNKTAATKATTTKKTKKTASSKKPEAAKRTKQVTAKKKPVAKKISLKKDIKLNNPTGDDLTKLSGIGPSMAATMAELGITTYKKLAGMDDDILRDMLEASGARLNNNKDAMDSWNEQAMLADKGDFSGLKKLQESLKS